MRTPLFLVIALALGTVGCDQKTPEQTPPPAPTAATPAPAAPANPAPVANATPGVAAAPAATMTQARVELVSTEGQTARGTLSLERAASGPGVTLYGNLEGLSLNGTHAFHIHENGDCSAPDGSSAGAHFNPDGKPHGHPNEADHHVGDMLSVKSDATGAGVAAVGAGGGVCSGVLRSQPTVPSASAMTKKRDVRMRILLEAMVSCRPCTWRASATPHSRGGVGCTVQPGSEHED